MKFNVKATAVTFGLFWGGAIFVLGLGNLLWSGYGQAVLDIVTSIYPGYQATASFWSSAYRHLIRTLGRRSWGSHLRLAL